VSTFASSTYSVLITLTLDEDGKPRIGQYLLLRPSESRSRMPSLLAAASK
jgi:hypothetical protein